MTHTDIRTAIGEIISLDDPLFAIAEHPVTQQDLESLAEVGSLDAQILLYIGATCGIVIEKGVYHDEATGEDIDYEEAFPVFDDPAQYIYKMSDESLNVLESRIAQQISAADTECLRHYIAMNGLPGSLAMIIDRTLSERGDSEALFSMAGRYQFGDEQYGIFVSKQKAREYYQKSIEAGNEFAKEALEYIDDEGYEDEASSFIVKVAGPEQTISEIESLIAKITEQCGVVTFDVLMKALVGSDEYLGVVESCYNGGDILVLEVETPNVEPLVYALEYVFEGVAVEAAIPAE